MLGYIQDALLPKKAWDGLVKFVERQAQHRPHRLGPIGEAEYRDVDRYEGRPVRCRNREAVREDIPQGIYFGS